MAQRDFEYDEPAAQILGFDGRIEVNCPACNQQIVQEGSFEGAVIEWECSCGERFATKSIAAELPRYRPE